MSEHEWPEHVKRKVAEAIWAESCGTPFTERWAEAALSALVATGQLAEVWNKGYDAAMHDTQRPNWWDHPASPNPYRTEQP